MRIRRIVMKRKRVSFLMVVLLALLLAAGCSGGSSSSGPSTVVPPKDDGSNGGEGGDEGDESKTLAKIEIVSIEMTGPSSVVVYCNTTDDGNGELKEMGVCYGTSADPDMSDSYEKYYDVHLGEFFLDIANIPSGILHFRPRVVNSAGESYGKDAILSWRTSGITGLTTSDGENLYVAINKGEHNGDLYLAKMRQSDGDMVWEKPASTTADRYDECRGITYLNGSIFMIVVENMPMFPGDTAQLPLNTGVIWFKRFNAETGELEKEEIIKDYGAVLDGGIVPDVSTGLLYMGYCTGAGAEYIIQLDVEQLAVIDDPVIPRYAFDFQGQHRNGIQRGLIAFGQHGDRDQGQEVVGGFQGNGFGVEAVVFACDGRGRGICFNSDGDILIHFLRSRPNDLHFDGILVFGSRSNRCKRQGSSLKTGQIGTIIIQVER